MLSTVISLLFILSDVFLAVIPGSTMYVFFDSLAIGLLIRFLIYFFLSLFLFKVFEEIYGVPKTHPSSE